MGTTLKVEEVHGTSDRVLTAAVSSSVNFGVGAAADALRARRDHLVAGGLFRSVVTAIVGSSGS